VGALYGFERDVDDLAEKAEDVLGVVFTVGVVDDVGALVGGDLVLVDYPFDRRAVAEAILGDFGREAAEGEESVVAKLGFVFRELQLLDTPVELADFDTLERELGLLLVVDM
jgi:hypothetical protein